MSLMISDPSRSAASRPYAPGTQGDARPRAEDPAQDLAARLAQDQAEGLARNLERNLERTERWVESWAEDDPEPVPAPRPVAPVLPLVGGAPAVPPTRSIALFAPIRAGGGRHRLPASVRRRPGPVAAGLLVAVAMLAVVALRGPQPPSCGSHPAAGAPARLSAGGGLLRAA